MLVKSITEIFHFFAEYFLYHVNTRGLQMHGTAVLPLTQTLRADLCCPAATATWEGLRPLPSSQQC